MPKWNKAVHKQLLEIKDTLEKHYRDVQDIEFTIERGTLFMLQTRNGKRTGAAAVKIACDMVKEKLIDEKTAVLRVPAGDLTQLLLPSFMPGGQEVGPMMLTPGLPASPGAAVGKLAFTAAEAVERTQDGEKVLLVRKETNPEDIDGMHSAVGILTSTGGMTSHAAVVARGWGRCCVAGAGEITIDEKARKIKVAGKTFRPNDVLSIDGSTGEVMAGSIATQEPKLSGDFATIMKWADKYRTLKVRTNADTPADAKRAREFGAQGIGLCRTEHMFFEGDRIKAMRAMILASNEKERRHGTEGPVAAAAERFRRHLQGDEGPAGDDPPARSAAARVPAARGEDAKRKWPRSWASRRRKFRPRVSQLHEMNPMLGHRGCRLAVTYPEILEMQVTAITEAVIACKQKKIDAQAEIMIPLVGTATRARDRWPTRSARRSPTVVEEEEVQGQARHPGRHDDRDPASRAHGRRNRRRSRLLQLRHQRPDADDVRLQPRRHQHVPARLPEAGASAA